jgi:hypothetical protein
MRLSFSHTRWRRWGEQAEKSIGYDGGKNFAKESRANKFAS